MKRIFKTLAVTSLLTFSVFYLNQINDLLINENELLEKIKRSAETYNVSAINAEIKGETIVPGLAGKNVDVLESYYNMRASSSFDNYYLVFNEVKPTVSIVNNLDKYIVSGNSSRRNVSFIIDDNEFVLKYLLVNNENVTKLTTYENYDSNDFIEYINNDIKNFNRLGALLDNEICVVNEVNEPLCKKKNYYLVKVDEKVTNENYYNYKKNIYSGQIFYISNTLSLENFKILYSEILFKGYQVVYLSELIKE